MIEKQKLLELLGLIESSASVAEMVELLWISRHGVEESAVPYEEFLKWVWGAGMGVSHTGSTRRTCRS